MPGFCIDQAGAAVLVNVRHVRVKNLLTKTRLGGDYAINPYVGCPHKCIYCYAACINWSGKVRDEPWGEYLDVKEPTESLNLANIFRKRILLSSMTDPYNPYEKKAEITRGIIKQLIPAEAKLTIITKSALVTRDIDLFKRLPYVKVVLSFSSLDNNFRMLAEPYASSPEQKIAALRMLKDSGIAAGVFVAPLFPEITDAAGIIKEVAPFVNRITFDSLNLRRQNADSVLDFIQRIRPDIISLYEDIYIRKNRLYWEHLRKEIKEACIAAGVPYGIFF